MKLFIVKYWLWDADAHKDMFCTMEAAADSDLGAAMNVHGIMERAGIPVGGFRLESVEEKK